MKELCFKIGYEQKNYKIFFSGTEYKKSIR
jgi:hypothetical protein